MRLNENIEHKVYLGHWRGGQVTTIALECSTHSGGAHLTYNSSLVFDAAAKSPERKHPFKKEALLLCHSTVCLPIVLKEVPFASVMCEFSVVTFDFRCHRHFFYLELPRKGEAKGGYEEEENRRMGFLSLIFIHPVKGLYKYRPIK